MSKDKTTAPATVQGVALANWGYEWLVHAAYQDLDQCVAELVERGYQGLIIDPCPHLVARDQFGEGREYFYVTLPPTKAFTEANSVKIAPRARLLSLLHLAKEYGIELWFSSVFLPDSLARRSFLRRPSDFIKAWADTLIYVEENQLEQVIKGIDFCAGFPLSNGASGAYRRIFRRSSFNPLGRHLPWTSKQKRNIDEYLLAVPRTLRALYPRLAFGVTAAAGAEPLYHDLSTNELDFIGFALWQDDDMKFQLSNGMLRARRIPLEKLRNRAAAQWYALQQSYWAEQWRERLADELAFCRPRRLQPMLIDGYVRVYEDTAYWPWVKQLSAERVHMALEHGIKRMVVSHYTRPSNEDCWHDVAWHQEITATIKAGQPASKPQENEDIAQS